MKIASLFSSKKQKYFAGKLPRFNEHTIFYGQSRQGMSSVDDANGFCSSLHTMRYDILFVPVLSVPDLSIYDDVSPITESESLKISYPPDSYISTRVAEYSVYNYYAGRSIILLFESLAKFTLNYHLMAIAVDIVGDHLESNHIGGPTKPICSRAILDALFCENRLQPFVESVRTKLDEIGHQFLDTKCDAEG